MRLSKREKGVLNHLGIIPFLLFAFFPLYWMIVTSFKKNSELYDLSSIPFWIQKGVTLDHYLYLFEKTDFLIWLKNTVIVSLVPTLIALGVSLPAAYALARLKFRGAELCGTAIFAVYLMPPALLFIPLVKLISFLKLSNTLWSLILTFPTFMIPFTTWMLSAYFKTLPLEVEESALIDGCNRLQMIRKIVIPLSIPGVITCSFFSFLLAWENLIYVVTFISSSSRKTISAGVVTELIRGDVFYWGSLMAGVVVASIPVVIAFVFLMDYYVSGLTAGATK
jgi:multiple sugar transport system permease protein